jgi:hypothetical protein
MTKSGHAPSRRDAPSGAKAPNIGASVDAFRAQHMSLATRELVDEFGAIEVLVNDSESPLAWLARRKGKDGRAMIGPVQFVAGERLRADFTRAHLSPRVTSDWSSPMGASRGGGAGGAHNATDLALAAPARAGGDAGIGAGICGAADGCVLLPLWAGADRT